MFVGIQFTEQDGGGIALVRKKWLTPRKSEVWWPLFKQQDYFNKSIKKGESPNESWKLYGVTRAFFEEGDYNKALRKIKRAEVISDFPSGDDDVEPIVSQKRRVIPSKRLFSRSSDEDETELRHPIPPKVKAISHLLNRNNINRNNIGSSSQEYQSRDRGDITELSHQSSLKCDSGSRLSSLQNKEGENSNNGGSCRIFQSHDRGDVAESSHQSSSSNIYYIPQESIGQKCDSGSSRLSSLQNKEGENSNNDFNKKILNLLVQIKNQNTEIIYLLKEKKSATGLHLDLPADIPVKLPLETFRDVRILEDYLADEANVSSMASYYGTLGGRDITNKINTILKNLMSNKVASEYSFLGTRNEKKSFQQLKLRKVVLNAVLSSCSSATENVVDDGIKIWLKHAPKRLSAQQAKAK